MAQCKYCGKKGLFLKVYKDTGLCKRCDGPVTMSIRSILHVLQESLDLIETSKNFNTRISRIDVVIDKCNSLNNLYWSKGITYFNVNPQQLINNIITKEKEIIQEELHNRVEKHLEKSSKAKTVKTKISSAEKALDEISAFRREFGFEEPDLEYNINSYIHKVQFDEFILNAEKNEFKGNIKKAIDQYQEALFFLKTDHIPDSDQSIIISELEDKINSLQVKKK